MRDFATGDGRVGTGVGIGPDGVNSGYARSLHLTRAERAEEAAKRLYFSYLEPIHFATRKHRRLEIFRVGSVEELSASSVDLQAGADGCVPVCNEMVEGHQRYLAKYLFAGGGAAPGSWRWRGVPLVIDLDRYPDFDHYAAQLKLQSKGAGTRQIRKARRLGLFCRPYSRAQRRPELFEIETSLRFRAGGPVVAAYLRRRPEGAAQPIVEREPPMPACLRHWSTDWGVFTPPDDGGADGSGERLIGFICLKRVGNIVQVAALMGHGAHLAGGIVKLLFADVMKWMLDRRDPRVRDIRYLHYGAIEQGNDGLAIWKHRFQFQPCIFRWPAPAPPETPAALSQVADPISTPPPSEPSAEPVSATPVEWLPLMPVAVAGERCAGGVRAKPSTPGFVIYGPYWPLAAGKYRVMISFSLDHLQAGAMPPETDVATIEAVTAEPAAYLAQHGLRLRDCGDRTFGLLFAVSDAAAQGSQPRPVEIRVWSSGALPFTVRSVTLQRMIDWV